MPNEAVLEQIETAELIQSIDDGCDRADPFKLTTAMRTLVNTPLADLETKDATTLLNEGDQTPNLAKIGKQPRHDGPGAPGEPEPFPDPAGTATFASLPVAGEGWGAGLNAVPKLALAAHATSLRAFRKPAGGTAELAGTSTTTTVSVIAAGPLTPGVTYEFWLVGHNFRGDGPESNHVTHAVPVGP